MKKLIGFLILLISFTSYAQKEESTIKVGDKAPMFKAKDQNGNVVKSADILNNEQLIVVFYRGQWCPLCNRHLSHLQDHVEDFKKAGAQLVAISPEVPVSVDKTVEKTNAQYPVLYDKDSKIMKEFGVEFMLSEKLQKKYKEYGIDLRVSNGNNDQLLPVPATYIIGKNGKVKYVQYDPDYKNRSNAKDILKHL
ncbi:peroxiredoxin-like family protein [Marinifilum caeruleilacunae]|uniref:thioredoxin-dependent peroxiredoxin n=1 Tax=Marinifilum caeruleilacunae TaxID=2499076 RepID=A0ABX1WSM6_9BACT|nr:peroxiredoxin-like family protein [Marinifilum caeruleilacunae]NOU59073.1 AhpC/TSA family protein [Marinifilum caeruleilacunae]